jgi:predicted ATPase
MLEKVGFKNFLALRDVEIDLEPFTVIVGPNSSGKSTILEGIDRISNAKNGSRLLVKRVLPNGEISYNLKDFLSRLSKTQEIEFSYKKDKESRQRYVADNYLRVDVSAVVDFRPDFDSKVLRFNSSEAAQPSYTESLNPSIEVSGKGLATVCSYLQDPKPDAFAWVQEKIRSVIPNLQRFRMKRAIVPALYWFEIDFQSKIDRINRGLEAAGQELVFDFTNAENIPASQVSEGTLFVLAVLVMAASSSGDTVLLIDDLERGLHPKAVRDLMTALREIQKMTPGLQIIATSHSPYILDRLEAKEVRVATLDPELGTLVAKLEDYPDFDKWREAMTPGEFWSFVGEDWVKDLLVGKVRG